MAGTSTVGSITVQASKFIVGQRIWDNKSKIQKTFGQRTCTFGITNLTAGFFTK